MPSDVVALPRYRQALVLACHRLLKMVSILGLMPKCIERQHKRTERHMNIHKGGSCR